MTVVRTQLLLVFECLSDWLTRRIRTSKKFGCYVRDSIPGLRLESPFFSEKKLHQENSFTLKWLEVKDQFEQWLESDVYSKYFKADALSYLRRYVVEVKRAFRYDRYVQQSQAWQKTLGLSVEGIVQFYEVVGVDKDCLDMLRRALPKVSWGIDLKTR